MSLKQFGCLIVCLASFYLATAQIAIDADDVPTFSTAAQGDLYLDENGVIYIGLQTGSLSLLSDFKPKDISNELLFEDNNYFYISMLVANTDYLVVRMDKSDVNIEGRASGAGAQPMDLASVQSLTYQ